MGEIVGLDLHTVIGDYALAELKGVGGEREAHERAVSAYRAPHGWRCEAMNGLDWIRMWEAADEGYFYDNRAKHGEGAANAGDGMYVATQD